MKKLLLIAVTLTLVTANAFAGKHDSALFGGTGNDLLKNCKTAVAFFDGYTSTGHSDASISDTEACASYVKGIADAGSIWQLTHESDAPMFCIPGDGVSGIQLVRIVVKHLEAQPESLHLPAAALTIGALRNAFPCAAK